MFFKKLFNKNKDIKKVLSESDNLKTDANDNKEIEETVIKKRNFMYGKKRYIPLIGLLVIIIAIIVARIYFSNERVKSIVEGIVYSSLNRKLEINTFKYSILFPKVEMNGVTLYNSTNFNERKNISIDNIKLRFSLFSLFTLKLHIKEFVVDNLYVDLFTDKYGNWNIPDMPLSKDTNENKEPFDFKKLDFLKLKADVQNIRINNLSFKADSLSYMPKGGMIAGVSNFNINLDLETKRFSISKAMSLEILKILQSLSLKAFLKDDVKYKDTLASFIDKPVFNFNLEYPKTNINNEDNIELVFDFVVDNPNFTYNNIYQKNFQIASHIKTRYNIEKNDVYVDGISAELFKEKILEVIASATDIFGNNAGLNVDTAWANIDLSKIKLITDSFIPSLGINMSGLINLSLQKTSGTMNAINNNITLSLSSINFNLGNSLKVSNINSVTKLAYNFDNKVSSKDDIKLQNNTTISRVLLQKQAPITDTDISIRAVSSLNGIMNITKTFEDSATKSDTIIYVDKIFSKYINATLNVDGIIQFEEPLDVNIKVTDIPVTLFTGGMIRGAFSIDANIFGKLLTDINLKLGGNIKNFSYNLGGDVSSSAQAKINVAANANLISQSVFISSINLYLDKFLSLKASADLKNFGLKNGYVNIEDFRFVPYSFQKWLSPNFRALIQGLPFQDDIIITSVLAYDLSLEDTFATVTNFTTLTVTEEKYNLQDVTMKVDSDVNFGNNMYANIRQFSIDSPKNNLRIRLEGLATADLKKADLKYELGIDTKSLYLPFGVEVGGMFGLLGTLKNNIAKGKLESGNFFASMDSSENMSIYLEDFNANADYNFDLGIKENSSSLGQFRYTPLVTDIPNIFFKQLRVYLKIPPFIDDSIRLIDFSSTLKVEGHGLTVQNLKSSLYIGGEKFDNALFFDSISNNTAPRRGAIYMPWVRLDLGNFNAATIRYDTRILASDINFKYLLPVNSRDKINDDKLLVNFTGDISGSGISPLTSIRLNTFFVGISKMSTEFSKFLIEMIRPINPGISTVENIVQFGYDPNSVEFSVSANKVFTTFYFRDQNLDKPNQQKQSLIAFEGDKFGLEPMSFSDIISYLEGNK